MARPAPTPGFRSLSARLVVAFALAALLLLAGRAGLTPAAHASTVGHPPTFGSASISTVGPTARSAVVADVNGDGKPDLVTANEADNTVSVLLGNGDGTFTAQPGVSLSPTCGPHGVAVADLNGDGKPDIVVACHSQNFVSVLLGGGDGTFVHAADYFTDHEPTAVAVADVNGDGIPDIVTANPGGSTCPPGPCIYTVSVLLGNGDGTFQAQADFDTGDTPESVVVGDVNGDGKPDIVTGDVNGFSSVLLGNGDGTFQAYQESVAGDGAPSIALTDVNGDGKLDIVVPDPTAAQAEVQLGNGDGTFQPFQYVITGGAAQSVAVADVNGDGKPDLLTEDANDNNVSLELGNGDGTFGAPRAVDIGGEAPGVVMVADLNRDGAPDVVTANTNSTASVALQTSSHAQPGTFQPSVGYPIGNSPWQVVTADVNGDGKADAVVTNSADNTVSVLLGNGDGTFKPQRVLKTGNFPVPVAVADVNGDGKPDIVTGNFAGKNVSVLLGNGDGTFQPRHTYTVGGEPSGVAIADVNGDGKPDLVTANLDTDTVSVLLGNGDGTFQTRQGHKVGSVPESVAVVDVNGDGKPDIVTANEGSNNVSVLLGNGDGTFQPRTSYRVGSNPLWLAVGDFNRDGKPDLVTANNNSVTVVLGHGDGTFTTPESLHISLTPDAVAVADVNGDGNPDVVVSSNVSIGGVTPVGVFLGKGDGGFRAERDVPTGSGAESVAIADLNGDGKPDLVTADAGSGSGASVAALIQYGRLDHFSVTAPGGGPIGTEQAGVPFSVRVLALDATGNTVSNFGGTVTVGSNRSIVGGPFTSDPFTNGTVTQQLTLADSGTGSFVSATNTGGSAYGRSTGFTVVAADGAGIATANPGWVANGAGGSSVGFTFNAGAGGMVNGRLYLQVPAGWPLPSVNPADPGYVVASRGTVVVVNNTIRVNGVTCAGGAGTVITYGSRAGGGPGVTAPTTAGPQTWNFKSQELATGTLQPLAASPTVTVLSPNGSGTMTPSPSSVTHFSTGNQIDFTYTVATGGMVDGFVKLVVPSGWSDPSTTVGDPGYVVVSDGLVTISGRSIIVSGVTLAGGSTLDIVYGSLTGGGPGATAPGTLGPQTWNASEISNSKSGGYVALASSPSITITP